MINVEVPISDVREQFTVQSFQQAILGIPNLPDGPKGMVADLFSGIMPPTDGDTFITFEDPKGGFFTVDKNRVGVVIAWHERSDLEMGRVEAALVGRDGIMYREHFNYGNEDSKPIVLVGEEAIPKITSFYTRRLRGEKL